MRARECGYDARRAAKPLGDQTIHLRGWEDEPSDPAPTALATLAGRFGRGE